MSRSRHSIIGANRILLIRTSRADGDYKQLDCSRMSFFLMGPVKPLMLVNFQGDVGLFSGLPDAIPALCPIFVGNKSLNSVKKN